MAESQQVSAFPLRPLQYVNQYTDENLKRGRAPQPPPPMQMVHVCHLHITLDRCSPDTFFHIQMPHLHTCCQLY